ncbi:protein of unknown function [Mucilaginibacter pineti]|uniref:DUF5077 domain-containing protein n=2 Tax=Mucilaginibacter pineti TaxID=1391627 RepID=A0A1G6WZ66_9SPHI|nr:protein of unknown function [Mucilaginibacter pineti]
MRLFTSSLLAIAFAGLVAPGLASAQTADTTNSVAVPVSGSGYTVGNNAYRVYFLTQENGPLQVALKVKDENGSKLICRLDANGKPTTIKVKSSAGYSIVPVATYTVAKSGYHFIEVKETSGNKLPDIAEAILSGPAAKDVKFNNSQYKGAPATHLTYKVPGDSVAAWFYSEVLVPKIADSTVNAYYETNGFNGGYMGIQHNSKNEKRFIFSIWSNYNTNDPKEIPSDYAITLIKKGAGVFTGEFGNEGSGGHSHLVFNWKADVVYKLLVGAKPAGDHTIFTAYYYAPENGGWKLIAQWDKTKTGGKLLSGLYSFVENFGDNGMDYFSAKYGNQWICTPSGKWMELTTARFTTTADKVKHPRFDYGSGVDGKWFYMFSGGFKTVGTTPRGTMITRPANGTPPAIDFNALPQQ